MHNWVVVQSVDVALRPVGMAPICTPQVRPPLAKVFQIDGTMRRRED